MGGPRDHVGLLGELRHLSRRATPGPCLVAPADRRSHQSHANPAFAALIDLALVMLFDIQHSVMARPWFKERVMACMPEPLQRVTYVHMANAALFFLILFWQPIPI